MAILQRYDGQDGIEILINTESGESFCSVKGYARMSGKDQSTISRRLASANVDQGIAESASKTAEVLTAGGMQTVALVNEDLIAEWLPKDNPAAATALLKLGVRVVLHNMAGYEVKSAAKSPLSLEEFKSYKHEFEIFIPWATEHPIAATIFLERQGVTPIVLDPTPVLTSAPPIEHQVLPSGEAMAALDGAFLNLNRSGLMMNKLFKFLDRVPTMKTLDEEFVNELTNSLSQAELIIKKTERDLSLSQKKSAILETQLETQLKEYDRLGRENKYLVTQNDLLHHEIEALKDELNALKLQVPIPVKATTTKTKVGTKTYKRPKAKELPPKPLRYALPPGN